MATADMNSGIGSEPVIVQIQLSPLIDSIANALQRASQETGNEVDLKPHNLLASFTRVASHIELFLQLTNTELHSVNASGTALEHVYELRTTAAQRLHKIGKALGCPNGYLRKNYWKADRKTCRQCFRKASRQIRKAEQAFRSTYEAIQE